MRGFGGVCTKRQSGGNLGYVSVMRLRRALAASIRIHPVRFCCGPYRSCRFPPRRL